MPKSRSSDDDQFDLFSAPRSEARRVRYAGVAAMKPSALTDDDLLRAIPVSGLADGPALMTEIGRRRLASGVPVLEAHCRRFAGFGFDEPVPEQRAAVLALGAIRGRAAGDAVRRLIERREIVGPTLTTAVGVAAALGVRLSAPIVLECLESPVADIRAAACRCAGPDAAVLNRLEDLLEDLHPDVQAGAAIALGRMGKTSARPVLLRLLRNEPSADALDAIAVVADEDSVVLMGRVMRERPELSEMARQVLEEIEHPLATLVLRSHQSERSCALEADGGATDGDPRRRL